MLVLSQVVAIENHSPAIYVTRIDRKFFAHAEIDSQGVRFLLLLLLLTDVYQFSILDHDLPSLQLLQ